MDELPRLEGSVVADRELFTRLQRLHQALAAGAPTIDCESLLLSADFYWVLDDAQQRRLLTLPPRVYDGDRGTWAIVRAETYWLRGDTAKARAYGDSAQLVFADQPRVAPGDARHAERGLALAYLGRKAEAIQEGKRGVALWPVSRDANIGAYQQHQLVRIYLLVGEPEKALDQLEPLLRIPSWLSPGRLRIDPTSHRSGTTRVSSGWWAGVRCTDSRPLVTRQTFPNTMDLREQLPRSAAIPCRTSSAMAA